MRRVEKLLTAKELADLFGISSKSVLRDILRSPDKLPPFVKIGRTPRWQPGTVRAWLAAKEGESTKEQKKRPGRPTKAEQIGRRQ